MALTHSVPLPLPSNQRLSLWGNVGNGKMAGKDGGIRYTVMLPYVVIWQRLANERRYAYLPIDCMAYFGNFRRRHMRGIRKSIIHC